MTENAGILGGCIVPHPPLLVPAIGGRDIEKVLSTQRAMEELGLTVADLQPDVLIMISPHSPIYRDVFGIKNVTPLEGSFAAFGRPQIRIAKNNDMEIVQAMLQLASRSGLRLEAVSAATSRWTPSGEELDHGLLVPLYYLDKYIETPVVCLSISGLSYRDHFTLGRTALEACIQSGRRAFLVASGDLSHRLIQGAPAGYNPRAAEFDKSIVEIASSGNFDTLHDIPEELVEAAGECGFRSIHALWGALKDGELENKVLSYEGPFGVGYLVSRHLKKPGGLD